MARVLVELAVFLAVSLLWAAGLGLMARAAGVDLEAMDGREAGLLGAVSLVGLAFAAVALAARGGAVGDALALRRPSARWLWVAAGAGATVWTLPTWLLGQLVVRFGLDGGALEQASSWIRHGRPDERVAMLVAVCLVAPVAEELVFRGHLWRLLGRASSPTGTLLGTSLLFAVYHGDPLQSVGVLPVGFLLGWLRQRSGSLWPSLVAHAANNLGAAAALLSMPASDPSLPLSIASFGAVCAGGCVALAARWPSPDGASRP